MDTARAETLRRLLSDKIPLPARGGVFLCDTDLPFLTRELRAQAGPGRLTVCERDLRSAARMRAACPDQEIRHTHEIAAGPGDVVILPVEKNRQALFLRLADIAARVGAAGRIYLYGSRREGIKPAQALLETHCAVEVANNKGGHRLLAATPRDAADWNLPAPSDTYTAEARERTVAVAAAPGLFSWDHLDDATAALLSTCAVREQDRLLDLGCAAGTVAAILLSEGKVSAATLVDCDSLALAAARRTLTLNGLSGEVLASDAGAELPDRAFDLILSNPPFHRGFAGDGDTVRRMIEQSHRLLAAKGRLHLVGPRSLKLSRHLEEVFGEPELLLDRPNFQVLRAIKKRHGRRRDTA